jgi:hypothetical protein
MRGCSAGQVGFSPSRHSRRYGAPEAGARSVDAVCRDVDRVDCSVVQDGVAAAGDLVAQARVATVSSTTESDRAARS